MKQKLFLFFISVIFLLASPLYSQNEIFNEPPESVWKVHVEMGIPYDNDTSDDYIIKRTQYVLSYNKNLNTANWVSWNLNNNWYGKVKRYKKQFITDAGLPGDYQVIKHKDYNKSGYDRGHMVRSEERTKTKTDNKATFILTNILPQRPDLNRGVWLRLERYCQKLCCKLGKELYIIAGGVFHSDKYIKNKIAIPDSCFKIIVILDKGQKLDDVNASSEIIAVMIPNKKGVRKHKWERYATSVNAIEISTGYNFLSSLPDNIEELIEDRIYGQ